MEENINESLSRLGRRILEMARNELYIHMRFLDVALSSFLYEPDPSIRCVATDGIHMFYHPVMLERYFRKTESGLTEAIFIWCCIAFCIM